MLCDLCGDDVADFYEVSLEDGSKKRICSFCYENASFVREEDENVVN